MPDAEDPKQVNNNDLRNAQLGGGLINAENVNAGRIGGDILNFFFGQQTTPIGNPARPKNERILLAAVKEEVTARLRQSLHNAVLINLGKESQPQQVKRPWDAEIKIGLKPPEPVSDTTTILEVFDSQEVAGKLLILGAPGSGKTTTQLELAQALVNRAEEQPDYPVPVLFNLSSWKDDRQAITDWLVVELKSKYGVSTKLGQEWVGNQQLLPLLDGLDELEPQRQELCVHVINQFLAGETRSLYLIVCSRIDEYNNYSTQLHLNGAIYLQPLTNNQICDYLISINSIELWSIINSDLDLLELVKTPLLLSITFLTSQEISVEEWQHLTSTADRIQYLLNAYIRRELTRDIDSKAYSQNKLPNAEDTQLWLVWLAQQMLLESQTEFLIEEMQPTWLVHKFQIFSYTLIKSLIGGLFYGLFYGVFDLLIFGVIVGFWSLIAGLMAGLTVGLTVGLLGLIQNVKLETIIVNEKIILVELDKESFIFLTIIALVSGLISVSAFGLIIGVIFGLISWIIFGLIRRQPELTIENKKNPNQGIWKSASNAAFFGLLLGPLVGLLIGLAKGLVIGVIIGLLNVLLLGLFFGGYTCIQHFILRLILYFNSCIPWNYARFLNYCTERMLLQRVGGRYRFIHKLLQDHFAQMEFRRD